MRMWICIPKSEALFYCIFAALSLVVGCGKYKDPEAEAVLRDIASIPVSIMNPSRGLQPHDLAQKVYRQICTIQDRDEQRDCLRKFEDAVYSVQLDSSDFKKREWQYTAFYEFADLSASCVLAIGEPEEVYWEKRIRLIKALQRQIDLVSCKNLPLDAHSSRALEFYARERFVKLIRDDFDIHIRNYEEFFNEKTCKRLSAERCDAIRRKIEDALGRKVRTMEEIEGDRWGR